MVIDQLRLDADRRTVQVALALMLVPATWFVRTDFQLYAADPAHLWPRLAVRCVMVFVCLAGIALVRRSTTRSRYSDVVGATALATAAVLITINVLRPPGAVLSLRSPLMTLFIMYAALPNRFWKQCLPPLLLSAGIIALRIFWVTTLETGGATGDAIVILVINAIGVLVVRRRVALEAEVDTRWKAEASARNVAERALSELRTLRGIIPICSHCRRVRTEVGDWQQLEWYVAQHSEAAFSHGICPDCVDRHYEPYLKRALG